jgi:hypothetical protein
MSHQSWVVLVCLASGLYGCSAPTSDVSGEPIASAEHALTLQATGASSAEPESGTLLPVSPARAPNITPPLGVGFGTPIVNVPGIANVANVEIPPDTVGDIGTNHYIQAVNDATNAGSLFTIYDKSGTPVSPEVTNVPLSELVATESNCELGNGDPIVNYDRAADRWVLLQFSMSGDFCIYVSGEDPEALDEWTLYDFDLTTLVDANGNPSRFGFPDYPKLSIWPDAYYVTTNDQVSGGADQDPAVYAFERPAMLAGTTARFQRFALPQETIPPSPIFQPPLAADWDSSLAPAADAPGIILRRIDEEVNRPGTGTTTADQLEIWELSVDFDDQTASVLEGPTVIATEDFDILVCGSTLCVTQPGTTQTLQTWAAQVMMYRLQYRNFGNREVLVGNFDVDDGAGNAAPHWYELERSGAGGWTLRQEDTLAIDANHRWMGSIAMDGRGNIGLGYSISSSTIFPGIRYTGRRATDALGMMTQPEAIIANGNRSQTGFSQPQRWGDYSAMTVDPVDDCTFWYTTEYYDAAVTGNMAWSTRIASFRFPECTACVPTAYEAESPALFHSTGGPVTNGWNIWTNGYIETNHTFAAGANSITVRARGQSALGVAPNMVVSVGGVTVGSVAVTATTFTPYTFNFSTTAGTKAVRVSFTNDFLSPPNDRNLYVDNIVVNCAPSGGSACTEATAVDLGAPGNNVSVPVNGCVRVRDGYPPWWGVRTMKLENPSSTSYPVPYTWTNTCSGSGGSGSFTADWQAKFLSVTSSACATLIDLNGTGSGNITLRYWAN